MSSVGRVTNKHRALLFLSIPLILIYCSIYVLGYLRGLEYSYIDFLFNFRMEATGVRALDSRLKLAAIDDRSIDEIGAVPWPRGVYAQLLDELMRLGADLVVFDVIFSEPNNTRPQDDTQLAQATKRWSQKVVHAFFEGSEPNDKGLLTVQQKVPYPELLKSGARIGFVDNSKVEGDKTYSSLDMDGTFRRAFLAKQTVVGDYALALGVQAFAILKGMSIEKYVANFPHEIYINFPGVLKRVTNSGKIFIKEPISEFSISDIIKKRLTPEKQKELKGAVVFVASTAIGYYDHYPTPYYGNSPGVSIHMYMLDNLLKNNYLRVWPSLLTILLTIALGLLLAISLERYSAVINAGLLAVMVLGLFGTSAYLFIYQNIIFDIMVPGVCGFLIFMTTAFYRFAVEEKEKRWIRSTFSQYLSPKVVKVLMENPDALRLGGEKRLMTMFFLDIADFTTISERLKPEELTHLLNYYLTVFTDVVLKYDGVVDKFIGDAIMAFWNAPFDQSDHALAACLTALEIRERIGQVKDIQPIKVRVGIHSGTMVVGNMGSAVRLNYTAVGDNVNFASRLEGSNKFFKTSLLISDAVYEQVKKEVIVRELGKVRVVGKENPVGVYELMGRKGDKIALPDVLALWEKAMGHLKTGETDQAKTAFAQYLRVSPRDPAAERYMKLLDLGLKDNFVINLTEK